MGLNISSHRLGRGTRHRGRYEALEEAAQPRHDLLLRLRRRRHNVTKLRTAILDDDLDTVCHWLREFTQDRRGLELCTVTRRSVSDVKMDCPAERRPRRRYTALQLACLSASPLAVRALLDCAAAPRAQDRDSALQTMLSHSCHSRRELSVLELLLRRGALPLNWSFCYGRQGALCSPSADLIRVLVEQASRQTAQLELQGGVLMYIFGSLRDVIVRHQHGRKMDPIDQELVVICSQGLHDILQAGFLPMQFVRLILHGDSVGFDFRHQDPERYTSAFLRSLPYFIQFSTVPDSAVLECLFSLPVPNKYLIFEFIAIYNTIRMMMHADWQLLPWQVLKISKFSAGNIIQSYVSMTHQPRSLVDLCRIAVRGRAGRVNALQLVQRLPDVPAGLRDALLFSDIQPLLWKQN